MSYLYFPSDRSSPHIPSTTPLPSPCHSFCHLVFSANQQLSPSPLSLMLCICNVLFSLPPHLVGTNLLQQWFIPSFTFSTTVFYLLNQMFYSLPACLGIALVFVFSLQCFYLFSLCHLFHTHRLFCSGHVAWFVSSDKVSHPATQTHLSPATYNNFFPYFFFFFW